jgi:hypothetical protein
MRPGKHVVRDLFLPRKEKTGIFLAAKIFTGPGDPDIFPKNPDRSKSSRRRKIRAVKYVPGIRVITR